MSQTNIAAQDPLVGTRLDGRYSVRAVLGQGGMGVVYEGVHDELGRAVAIKVLNTAWASDPTAVERFLREARTASSFTHGNIVDVSDLGRLPDGRPYLVMPKIAGTDLTTLLLDSGPQPAKRVAELLFGVAAALDLIHAKGYVHRDIKPENLMYVVREDGSETVMLLDFGIAALVLSNEPRLTHKGAVFGTPHYMPPEACNGALPDARGDVYALATVAFELITGRLPFDSDNLMQVLSMKLTREAPSLGNVTGDVWPVALETVIAGGLTRDPKQRFATASEFVTALRAVTNDAPVSWRTGVLRNSMRSAEQALGTHRYTPDPPLAREATPVPSPGAQQWQETRDTAASPSAHTLGAGLRERERARQQPTMLVPARKSGSSAGLWLLTVTVAAAGFFWLLDPGGLLRKYAGLIGNTAVDATRTTSAAAAPKQPAPQAGLPPTAAPAKPLVAPASANLGRAASAIAANPVAEAAPSATTAEPGALAADRGTVANAAPTNAAPNPIEPAAVPDVQPTTSAMAAAHAASADAASADALPPSAASLGGALKHASNPPPSAASHGSGLKHASAAVNRPASRELTRAEPRGASQPEASAEPAPSHPGSPILIVKQNAAAAPPEPAPAPPEPELPQPSAAELTRDATAALLRGEVSKAVELAGSATRLDPEHAAAWRTQGLAHERAGNARAAMVAYQRFLSLAPTGAQSDLVRERMLSLEK